MFTLLYIVFYVVLGGLVGWLAGLAFRRRGYGCVGNVVIGVIGAVVGGVLFRIIGLGLGGLVGSLFTAFVGAVLFLVVAGLFRKK